MKRRPRYRQMEMELSETPVLPAGHTHWVKFYVDGGTIGAQPRTRGVYWSMRCEDGSGDQSVVIRCKDEEYSTNNDAEWLAVREALRYAAEHHAMVPIVIYSDSMLVVKQFNGEWRTKLARHHRLRTECKLLAEQCHFVVLQWVSRNVNVEKLGH